MDILEIIARVSSGKSPKYLPYPLQHEPNPLHSFNVMYMPLIFLCLEHLYCALSLVYYNWGQRETAIQPPKT